MLFEDILAARKALDEALVARDMNLPQCTVSAWDVLSRRNTQYNMVIEQQLQEKCIKCRPIGQQGVAVTFWWDD